MNKYDACRVLGLIGEITEASLKYAFRKATSKYHPDRNPAGLEMMKLVNEAYSVLKDEASFVMRAEHNSENVEVDYGSDLNDALNAIITCVGLNIEVCGSWVWISGDTKTHKAVLKEAGFKWAAKKKMWYFRPAEWKSRSKGRMTMNEIRDYYGSDKIETKRRTAIA